MNCISLSSFLSEYTKRNVNNEYRPVAVGRYGIRTRESIYSKELAKDYSRNKLIYKNTLTVGMGSTQIDIGILTEDMIYSVSPAYHTYRISNISSEYLRYCLECRNQDMFIRYVKRGSRQGKTIDLSRWLTYKIPVCDTASQQKIVSHLDKVSDLIEKRRQQLDTLDQLVKSRFIELFGNIENKIPIGEMCNVTGGYSFKSGDISNEGVIKILQIGNVYLDNLSWETTSFLPEGYDEKYSKFMLNEGDIVVALTRPIIQSLRNVKACIVKSSDLPCLLNQRVGRIVAKNEKTVFLEFIYGCLMTDDFTRYVESCSIGCSQPNISTKDIENYLIPNATYEEQKAYAEFKKQTDKSKLAVQKSLDELETLKKALMQEYFG